jgi:transcriptional regulator with XRE-family HTH domain
MYINTKNLEFLVNKLHKRGWRMSEIAEELGINERTLYRWTSGEIAVPRIALLALTLIVKAG